MGNRHWRLALQRHGQPAWNESRNSAQGVKQAVQALSAGSLRSCVPSAYRAYLEAQRQHHGALVEEFVVDRSRAVWNMMTFRKKRACLDRAANRFIEAATKGQPKERKLVVGIGTGTFASGGKGEISMPTDKIIEAFKRAFDRVRRTGREVRVFPIWEFRTTMCCCACGQETTPPVVRQTWKCRRTGETRTKDGPSRRLRQCTGCIPGSSVRRDRDVQGARNMLWLVVAEYYGLPRPDYLDKQTGR